jgi:anti-sigma B factor antagonist
MAVERRGSQVVALPTRPLTSCCVWSRTGAGKLSSSVVAGEIDIVTAARMHETLVAQLSPRPELMVIDLEGVGFLGSMGLTALALTERLACEQGVELRIVATSRTTLRPLEITGMASDLAVYASREEALAGRFGSGPDALPAPRIP